MAHGLLATFTHIEESPAFQSRRSSRAGSITSNGNKSRTGSISFTHVSPLVDSPFMAEAIAEARMGLKEGGIPVGSVLVRQGQVIARGHNRRVQRNSAILHAEMDCLESSGRQPAAVYNDCTLYTTLSPCPMCSGAIRLYGIPRVVIGDNKTYLGDTALLRANNVQVDVLDSHECCEMMVNFIKEKPKLWYEDIGQK